MTVNHQVEISKFSFPSNRRLAQLVRAFGLHPKGHRFESYIFYNNWEYRIAAIAADCKSAPSGSVVRVHLLSPIGGEANLVEALD